MKKLFPLKYKNNNLLIILTKVDDFISKYLKINSEIL